MDTWDEFAKKYGWEEIDDDGTVALFLSGEAAKRYREVFGPQRGESEGGGEGGDEGEGGDV